MSVLEVEDVATSSVVERRRPGRPEHVSPELIPLLRGEAAVAPEIPLQFGDPDQLRSARGIVAGLALSAVLWAAIAYAGRWVF